MISISEHIHFTNMETLHDGFQYKTVVWDAKYWIATAENTKPKQLDIPHSIC